MPTARKSSPRKPAAKKYPSGRYVVTQLKAPNTPSGNPRRVFVAVHVASGVVYAFDEGYQGIGALPATIRKGMKYSSPSLSVGISGAEYIKLRKFFE